MYQYWQKLGIGTVDDLKKYIDVIFESHDDQHNVLIDLYQIVFPDWDKLKKIKGYPEVGNALSEYICNRFIDFDRMFHPGVIPGGAWLNWGFSTNAELEQWEISIKNCSLELL